MGVWAPLCTVRMSSLEMETRPDPKTTPVFHPWDAPRSWGALDRSTEPVVLHGPAPGAPGSGDTAVLSSCSGRCLSVPPLDCQLAFCWLICLSKSLCLTSVPQD